MTQLLTLRTETAPLLVTMQTSIPRYVTASHRNEKQVTMPARHHGATSGRKPQHAMPGSDHVAMIRMETPAHYAKTSPRDMMLETKVSPYHVVTQTSIRAPNCPGQKVVMQLMIYHGKT